MATMFCALCQRPVDAHRQIGLGTIVGAVLTMGVSLLAIPFYSKRCAICKSSAVSEVPRVGGTNAASFQPPEVVELRRRLGTVEGELEATNLELDRLRTERDFYRQLVGDPAARERRQSGGE